MAFAEIEGTVTRTFFNGKGAEVTETFEKNDGSEGKSRFALWFKEPHGLAEGDSGKWRGALSVKVDEWKDQNDEIRHSAKISLNGAKAVGDKSSRQAAPVAPADEPWAAATPGATTFPAPAAFDFPAETPF